MHMGLELRARPDRQARQGLAGLARPDDPSLPGAIERDEQQDAVLHGDRLAERHHGHEIALAGPAAPDPVAILEIELLRGERRAVVLRRRDRGRGG